MSEEKSSEIRVVVVLCITTVLIVAILCATWAYDWRQAYAAGYKPYENQNGVTKVEKP